MHTLRDVYHRLVPVNQRLRFKRFRQSVRRSIRAALPGANRRLLLDLAQQVQALNARLDENNLPRTARFQPAIVPVWLQTLQS